MADAFQIQISGEEWETAASLIAFAAPDERDVTGMLLLECDGTRRRWWATDSRRLATDQGDPDDRVYQVLVSPRSVQIGCQAARAIGVATLEVVADDAGPTEVVVSGAGLALRVAADRRRFPDVHGINADFSARQMGRITLDAEELAELVSRARWRPLAGEDSADVHPLFWLGIDQNSLTIRIDWPSLGVTEYRAAGVTDGTAAQAIPAWQLTEALAGLRGDVTIGVPEAPGGAIFVTSSVRSVLIMSIDTSFESQRADAERLIADVFGPDAVHRDHDGDYPLSTRSTPIFARLVDDQPVRMQVFAVVLGGVESTRELLAELNDHNARLGFVRTFWVANQVLVESDLVAATADPPELIAAFDRVRDVAEDLGPMLAAVHGGELTSVASIERRWQHYASTTIRVEAFPENWVDLSGSAAVEELPYPSSVHVISAHNPFGRVRPTDANQADNLHLAARLIAGGAGIQHARGIDPSSSYEEAGFVAWGLDLETARSIGREFGQEAIFEVDADTVRVIACVGDRVAVTPRRAPSTRLI